MGSTGLAVSNTYRPLVYSGLLVAMAGLGLASTNPDRENFADFAGNRLTQLLTEELCRDDGLPLMARLVIRDCPELVASQRQVLGELASSHSRRSNFLLFSVYQTDLKSRKVMPSWRLPGYRATTLALAGHFYVLESREARRSDSSP